ncbi:MAG: hypothetical protein M1330_02915 [Armatimonadetes bacterium]|nr:hypothetical protein [Armatimonadota bacterium]
MSITGGSIPIGRAVPITGQAVLPGNQPAANATVQVTLANSSTNLLPTPVVTNGQGRFQTPPISFDPSLIVIVQTIGTNGYRMLAPMPVNPTLVGGQPLNTGTVDARSSVVARAVQLEQASGISSSITSPNLESRLLNTASSETESESEENDDIHNSHHLDTHAAQLITDTANDAVGDMAQPQQPLSDLVVSMQCIIAYGHVNHGWTVSVSDTTVNRLAKAQLNHTIITPAALKSAMMMAGIMGVHQSGIMGGSVAIRRELGKMSTLSGSGLSPAEVLAIMTVSPSTTGFVISSSQLDAVISNLYGP